PGARMSLQWPLLLPLLLLQAQPPLSAASSRLGSRSVHLFAFQPDLGPPDGESRYGVVIDAGSTGSRVHVFHFAYRLGRERGRPPYLLAGESYLQVKPGLSAYSAEPAKGARSLLSLMELCKSRIPQSLWSRTPLVVMATAGLRLLSLNESNGLLREVRSLLAGQPFPVGAVEVLDGLDEGVFSWLTVNFLAAGQLQPATGAGATIPESSDSFGALDLGGGSAQITFAPTIPTMRARRRQLSLGPASVWLYSHSYLGVGLMAARLRILGGDFEARLPACLASPCLPPGYSGRWRHHGAVHTVSGVAYGYGYAACRSAAARFLRAFGVHAPRGLRRRRFFAFGYFYDRAADAGLISAKLGGAARLLDFEAVAKRHCRLAAFERARPYLCLDLAYIAALLGSDGLGFESGDTLVLRNRYKDIELSWALGAMFDILHGSYS
uniref:Ectonucleoside triphosphate diphosphohydrolase 5 n=1 Tax=Macrostomum lignano TaxID=282301 RepID=A0A1I8I978_9PLAT